MTTTKKRKARRPTGAVRKLPSLRWQASTWDAASGKRVSLGSFPSKADADAALALAQTDKARGAWTDPRKGKVLFGDYALQWLDGRRGSIGVDTWANYEQTIKNHVLPTFGKVPIADITSASVRIWHDRLRSLDGPGNTAAGKAYSRLSQILTVAVGDEIIPVNRANVKRGRDEKSPPRPEIDVDQAMAIIAAANRRIRPLIILALGAGLRRNELRGLRQKYLNLDAGTVEVKRSWRDSDGSFSTVKTDTSNRTVSLPEAIIPAMRIHVESLQNPGPDNVVFPATTSWGNHTTEQAGRPFSVGFLNDSWCEAVTTVFGPQVDENGKKLPGALHLHDLRHTSLTLAGEEAALKDLMTRGGHDDVRTTMRYQNKSKRQNDQNIADRMSAVLRESAYSGNVLGVEPSVEVVGAKHDVASGVLDGKPALGH